MAKKRFVVSLVWLIMAVLVVSACGSNQGGSGNAQSGQQPSQSSGQQAPSQASGGGSGQAGGSEQTNKQAASDYPNKPIQLIVPFAAGGGTDAVGRALAEALSGILGQDVVVVNITGGSGAVGMNEGLRAKPDGYTITMVSRGVISLPMMDMAPFQPHEFKFIANINTDPSVVVVSNKSKYETMDDLLADLKANPGKLTYASSALPDFPALQFAQAAGVEFAMVPLAGAAPAIVEILGGRADFGAYGPGEVKAHVESGDLRPLALMAESRLEWIPDVPTMRELGIDVVSETWRGIAVPSDTPDEIVRVLEDAIEKAVQDPKFVEFMNTQSLIIDYKNKAEFEQKINDDIKFLEPVIEIAKQQSN